MAARSLPEMAEYREKMKLPPSVSCFIQGPQESTAPRVPGVLCVLLHCCTAVCSKGLVGGWVEGTLRGPWWVGGPFRTWESFLVLWEMNLYFGFLITGLPLVLGSTTVPTAALLWPLPPYVLLHCSAVLLPCYYFVF